MFYKVKYAGYFIVEAASADEALGKDEATDGIYGECEMCEAEEIDWPYTKDDLPF